MNSEIMLKALDEFLSEAAAIADKGDYKIEAATDEDGKDIDVVVTNSDDYMPDITVKCLKVNEGVWEFTASVSFPIVDIDDSAEKLSYVLDDWKVAAELVDYLVSVRFDINEWIETAD